MGVDNRGLENIVSGLSLKNQKVVEQIASALIAPVAGVVVTRFAPHIAQVLALKNGLSALSKVSGLETRLTNLKPNLADPQGLFYSVANAFTGQNADNPQDALRDIAIRINQIQETLVSTGFRTTDATTIAKKPVYEAITGLANYAQTVANVSKIPNNKKQAQAKQQFGFNMPGTV